MKHKFSSMGRVAIALVLALSLSLVMAVPAVAMSEPSVTLNDYATDAEGVVYTIEFDVGVALSVGNNITVTFPAGTTVPSVIDPSHITVEEDDGGVQTPSEVGVDGRAVTITTPIGLIEAGHTVEVVFLTTAEIDNPSDGGDYRLDVHTTFETAVASAAYTITKVPASFEVVAGLENEVTAGEAFSVVITALKANDTPEDGYTGDHLIDFTYDPSTPAGTLPGFEVVSFSKGVGTSPANFILTDTDEVTVTITATDSAFTSLPHGTTGTITINPAVGLHHFTISGEAGVVAGVAFTNDITVTAYDAENNIKTDYVGMVSWSSSDTTATPGDGLPADYPFVAGDEGFKAFDKADFILKTSGPQTITVTDAVADVEQISISIAVTADEATALEVESDVAVIRAGSDTATITVSAVDDYGNVDTSDTCEVTVTSSLGSIANPTSTLSDGTYSNATLTSTTDVGTATIKVVDNTVEGPLPYVTTTVELVAADAVTEAWVDDDGTIEWEAIPTNFDEDNIQAAIDYVDEGGTVHVLPGTYTLTSILFIRGEGLTLKSTDGAAVTIIDASEHALTPAIQLIASDVIFEGFTVKGNETGDNIWIQDGTEGVTVKNNIITGVASHAAIHLQQEYVQMGPNFVVTGAIISGNVIEGCKFGITLMPGVTDSLVEGNRITGCTEAAGGAIWLVGGSDEYHTKGNIITGNTITGNAGYGINITLEDWYAPIEGEYLDDNLIEKNTISGNAKAGIEIAATLVITDLSINNNDIYSNGYAAGPPPTYCGIENLTGIEIDAENNWWGDDSGPYVAATNVAGTGDAVVGFVDYRPWLTSEYTEPVAPVTTYPITLTAGYNLVSLPLIPEVPAIDTMTVSLTELEKIYRYDALAETPDWLVYNPAVGLPGSTLLTMDDDWGYWVKMTDSGSFTFSGSELVAGPEEVPPSYEVAKGWNLIGFKSTTTSGIAAYLGGVAATLDAIYGYRDGAFFIPTELEPGLGYWIAVTELGTIYP